MDIKTLEQFRSQVASIVGLITKLDGNYKVIERLENAANDLYLGINDAIAAESDNHHVSSSLNHWIDTCEVGEKAIADGWYREDPLIPPYVTVKEAVDLNLLGHGCRLAVRWWDMADQYHAELVESISPHAGIAGNYEVRTKSCAHTERPDSALYLIADDPQTALFLGAWLKQRREFDAQFNRAEALNGLVSSIVKAVDKANDPKEHGLEVDLQGDYKYVGA